MRSGLDIQRLERGGRATDYSSLGRHLSQSCGAGARDSGAEKKMGAIYTSVLSIFIYTPEKSQTEIQAWETGEKVEEAHTKRGLNSQGEGGLKDCACWSGES